MVSSHDAVQHHPTTHPLQDVMTSSHVSVFLWISESFGCAHLFCPPLGSRQEEEALHWGLVGNMAGFQRERLFGAIPFSAGFSCTLNVDSTTFCVLEEKKRLSIFRFLFFSSIFRYLESVLHPHSYCSSLVFFHVLFHNPHMFYFFYKKQTAPMSTPNSWSAPPMSMGAMSTMGSLDVFWVLYSITVLAHWPVRFCKTAKKPCKWISI